MNTTPKQQDGEGSTAESGTRASLEQTVMGVPPPPSSGVAPASVVQAVPAEPAIPVGEGVQPVPTPATVHPVPTPATVHPVPMPATVHPVPMPATVHPVPTPATVHPVPMPIEAPPAEVSGPAIVATPTISVAPVPVQGDAIPPLPVAAPPELPEQREREPQPEAAVGDVGDTVQLGRPAAPTIPRATPRRARASQESSAAEDAQHTALSADYLRAARDAALGQLASDITPLAPVAAPPPDASPSQPSNTVTPLAPVVAVPREAAPSRPAQDTPRTPLAAAAHDHAVETLAAPWVERAPSEASPSNTGTRPSIAPPFAGHAPVATERAAPQGSRGFEPVPVLRAPLAESLSGSFGPIAELGGPRSQPPALRPHSAPSRRRDGAGRWMLLGSVALATVGVVTFGSRVWDRYRTSAERKDALTAAEVAARSTRHSTPREAPLAGSASTSRALMANRPAPESAGDGRVRVVSATGVTLPGPAREGVPAAGASPESQLAATAGRHVLTGNYAEALPLYRQLEHSWPETTAYAAMSRLLEKKVGTMNDTQTITPAAPSP
jgi:hypothetical protein